MVSLWPWKGEDNSPASFEKTLSNLSTKITQTTTRQDAQRQLARRFKALWTLYTSFAYLLYSIVVALVVGWENYGLKEIPALVGGPVIIYTIRAAATKFFDYRISRMQRQLDDLEKERDQTIEKLKVATKYNSTQQLLEKYGGETPEKTRPKDEKRKPDSRRKPSSQQQPVPRTGIPPPPTANIRRPSDQPPATPPNFPPPSPYAAQPQPQPQPQPSPFPPQTPQTPQSPPDAPAFAPNAFPSAPQYIEQPHWYDRLLDVLLGEDETQPKNRIVLICKKCRLVNGQAPPGVKTLEELGRWRCGSCGTWNGESETAKALANIKRLSVQKPAETDEGGYPSSAGEMTDEVVVGEEDVESDVDAESAKKPAPESEAVSEEPEPEPEANRRSTRSRAKANKRKG